MPSPAGFAENLHSYATLRVVFSAKALPYSFFTYNSRLQKKKKKYMGWAKKTVLCT